MIFEFFTYVHIISKDKLNSTLLRNCIAWIYCHLGHIFFGRPSLSDLTSFQFHSYIKFYHLFSWGIGIFLYDLFLHGAHLLFIDACHFCYIFIHMWLVDMFPGGRIFLHEHRIKEFLQVGCSIEQFDIYALLTAKWALSV